MTTKSGSSNAPRKFSEKIALLKQKEAETNASFETIMRDVNKVSTSHPSTGASLDSPFEYPDSTSSVGTSSESEGVCATLHPSFSSPSSTNSTMVGVTSQDFPFKSHADALPNQQFMTQSSMQEQYMPQFAGNIQLGGYMQDPNQGFKPVFNAKEHMRQRLEPSYLESKTASMPNVNFAVNQAAVRNSGSIDLQSALSNLERMKTGREVLVDHFKNRITKHHSPHGSGGLGSPTTESSNSTYRSPRLTHRTKSDNYQTVKGAPYPSPYLSPPLTGNALGVNRPFEDASGRPGSADDKWRRVASDSAIRQSLSDQQPNSCLLYATGQMGPPVTTTCCNPVRTQMDQPVEYQMPPNSGTWGVGNDGGFNPNIPVSSLAVGSLPDMTASSLPSRQSLPNTLTGLLQQSTKQPVSYADDTSGTYQGTWMTSAPTSCQSRGVVSQAQAMQGNVRLPSFAKVTATTYNPPNVTCPVSPLASVQEQFENRRMKQEVHSPPTTMESQNLGEMSQETYNLFSRLPDIVFTEPECERRDSFTMTNEILSGLGSSASGFAGLLDNDVSLLDISDSDLQLLTDPNMADYVTDDITEKELLQEQRFEQL